MMQNIIETAVEKAVAEAAETAGTVEAVEAAETVDAAGISAEAIDTEEEAEAVETEEAAETVDAAGTPAEAIDTEEEAEAVETAEAAETMETAEAEKIMEAADTAEAAKTMAGTEETAEREAAPPTHRKAFLIDSENVSDEWVDLLDTMERQDAIFVFYTGKSTHINCERVCKLMRRGIDRVHWIKCFEGNNALDFQLVTELGAMIGRGKAAEYIIVSKDNGYNPVVRYWNNRGIAVSKKGTKADKKTEEPVEIISVSAAEKASSDKPFLESADKAPLESAEKTPLGKAEKNHLETAEIPSPVKVLLTGSVKAALGGEFLSEVLKSVDIMDNTMLYPVLTAFEGQAAGAEDYRQLRDLSREEKTTLRGLLLHDKRDRGMNYVRLIVRRNHWAVDVEELYEIILRSSKKNKDKYRKALVERFGKESGENYYNITKSHYNYVKKV